MVAVTATVPWPLLCLGTVVLVFVACVALTGLLARTPLAKVLTGRSPVPWSTLTAGWWSHHSANTADSDGTIDSDGAIDARAHTAVDPSPLSPDRPLTDNPPNGQLSDRSRWMRRSPER